MPRKFNPTVITLFQWKLLSLHNLTEFSDRWFEKEFLRCFP
jgi:hypothetical protein